MKKALQLAQILQQRMTAHQHGRLAEAARSYQAVLDLKRDDFDSLHLLGVLRWQQRRHDEASKLIKQALRVRPDSAEACANLGIVLQSLDRSADFAADDKSEARTRVIGAFDVARTCRHVEAAYATMWEIHVRGESSRSFRVEPN